MWWKVFQNHAWSQSRGWRVENLSRRSRHSHYLACQVCFGLQINYFSSWWQCYCASLPAILQWHRFQYLHTEVQQVTDQTDRCKIGGMQLTDWHAFVYRMRCSKFIFWPWKTYHIETTDWEQDIPRCFCQIWSSMDDILQWFTCRMYSLQSTTCDINDLGLRYKLLRAKKKL